MPCFVCNFQNGIFHNEKQIGLWNCWNSFMNFAPVPFTPNHRKKRTKNNYTFYRIDDYFGLDGWLIRWNCLFDSSYCWPVNKRLLTKTSSHYHYVLIIRLEWKQAHHHAAMNGACATAKQQPQEMEGNGKFKRCTVSCNRKRNLWTSRTRLPYLGMKNDVQQLVEVTQCWLNRWSTKRNVQQ